MKRVIAVLLSLVLVAPVFATDRNPPPTNPNPPPTVVYETKDSDGKDYGKYFIGAVLGVIITYTVCYAIGQCQDRTDAPVTAAKDDGSIVPATANDSSTLYGVETKTGVK